MRRLLCLAFLLLAVCRSSAQDGIFADFVTNQGNFTCQLAYDKAPRTVANFIGLATGNRRWLDLATGAAQPTPFYDGLTFHRVVSGFVIQGGSRKGDGSDGPGYTFTDEFNPALRHSKAGILSMANSGLNSNGSQFFITLAATSFLDDVHSVFGEVTGGMSVVQAIGGVPVDGNSKPTTPVVMQSVTIRRVGAAAQAFDINAQGLPTVGSAAPKFVRTGASSSLQFSRALYSEYTVFDAASLAAATWIKSKVGLYVTTPPSGDLDVTSSAVGSSHFYRVPQVAYPGPLFTPPSVAGGTFTLALPADNVVFAFNAAGTGGTVTINGGAPSQITQYSWGQEAYRGQLVCYSSNYAPFVISFVFANGSGGNHKGTYYSTNQFQFTGTFTYSTAAAPFAAAKALTLVSTAIGTAKSAKTVKDRRSKRGAKR